MKTLLLILSLSFLLRDYPSYVTSVYDGDTITVEMDLGMGVSLTEKIRLKGIDAPEMRGSERTEGIKSRDALRKMIFNKRIIIKTEKDKKGKYGRLIGTVYYNGRNINRWMVSNGYAREVNY